MSGSESIGESQPLEQPDERDLLRVEIEKTREDLGETVEALANKADVKGQVHDKVEDTKAQLYDKVDEVKAHVGLGGRPANAGLRQTLAGPAAPAALAALCGLLLLRSILRRR